MAFTIALSGKGGSGKTTVAALTVRDIAERTGHAVLAVDADSNATLGLALGVSVERTVAEIREDAIERRLVASPGMDKRRAIEYAIHHSLGEHSGFDLLTMGRPEGPKCYCYVNHLLRAYLDGVSSDYAFVVIDNEAGMEHLSRRTTNDVDVLVVVSEPTMVGLRSAARVLEAAASLPITVRRSVLVLNRVRPAGPSDAVRKAVEDLGVPLSGIVSEDEALLELAETGRPVIHAPADRPAVQAVTAMVEDWLPGGLPVRGELAPQSGVTSE